MQPSKTGGKIEAREFLFGEDLILNRGGIAVTIEGGYDIRYLGNSGYTTLMGILTVRNGSLIVEGVEIR